MTYPVLDMPGMDGMELLRTIRRDGISLPVLIMTGRVCSSNCSDLSVQGYLVKPVEIPDLIEKIRNIIHPPQIP